MNDQELDLALGAMGRTRTHIDVPTALRERVAAVPATTPRRRRWLPRVASWPRPIFSAARFIVAAAIVVLFGGLVVAGMLTTQTNEGAPAAATDVDVAAPVWVTGAVWLARCSGMISTSEAGVTHERGYVCSPQSWTTSDPRLKGFAKLTWNADVYESDEGPISLSAGTYDVRSESGGWLCHYTDGVAHGSGEASTLDSEQTLTCAGDGANEGLSAMLILDWSKGLPSVPLSGLIFTGEAPPLPELSVE